MGINHKSIIMQPSDPKFQLVDFSTEEAKVLMAEVDVVMAKYSAAFVVAPTFTQDGRVEAKLHVYKKLELVPKGVPSPFVNEKGQISNDSEGGEPQVA